MVGIQDFLAAIGGVLDAVTQAILAMSYGFAMAPSALAYAVGIAGCLAFGSVVPISFQAETITLAGSMGKDKRERTSIILFGGLTMAIIGVLGLLETIINFAGEDIISAMMAGVGIILSRIALKMVKENVKVGVVSMVVAITTYLLTKDLVYTIVAGVIVSSAAAYFMGIRPEVKKTEKEKFKIVKPTVNFSVIRGALAVVCLTIGGNIAFGGITADIAGTTANADHISIYSGLADFASALFGGAPISVIISATAAAPNAMWSGIILMALMFIILITGLLPKIAKWIPVQAISGTLFVLGAFVTTPENAFYAFSENDGLGTLASGITMVVTAVSDPFFGLVAGIIIKMIGAPLGLA